jgi:phosphoribosylanthranilate isomerase
MSPTKIKICGLFREQDAAALNRALPDYAGFVFYEKSRRFVTPAAARALRAALDAGIVPVGVFVDAPIDEIARRYAEGTIAVAQLHGGEDAMYIAALRARCPGLEIWRAYRIRAEADVAAAARSAADRVLLDGGAGEGKPFDWSLIAGFPRPFVLAGGLTPETIPEAIARLHPFAVDISSGVETDGVKDEAKIMAAAAAARRDESA